MVKDPVLVGVIKAGCTLGEGPVWDHRKQCLWWTDIQKKKLHCWQWGSDWNSARAIDLPERLGSLGLTEDPDQLVCAFESGFALFEPASGALTWLDRPTATLPGIRMNDGRVDAQGRFWAGAMAEDLAASGGALGSLYMLDAQGKAHERLDQVYISNSICWSPDGSTMYFADSPKRRIRSFACGPDGTLGDESTFAIIEGDPAPDGSDTDRDGRVWNAEWGGSRVTVYDSDGSIAMQFAVPVLQPTCVAFGGPDLDHVFVTSAKEGLSAEALAPQPLAGDTLVYRIGPVGKQASLYRHLPT